MKKITLVMTVILLTACLVTSCNTEILPQEFSVNEITITLDNSFMTTSVLDYTRCYQSPKGTVYLLEEKFDASSDDRALSSEMTLSEYAVLVLEANNKEGTTLTEKDERLEFVFEAPQGDVPFTYHVCLYKGNDAFWMFQFVTPSDYYDGLKDEVDEWTSSVVFEENSD